MDHGAGYNLLRSFSVVGTAAGLRGWWLPLFGFATEALWEPKAAAVPLALACVVMLLHSVSASRLPAHAKLRFVERVVYYAAAQTVVLLALTHVAKEAAPANKPPVGLTALYMLYDAGHHLRRWASAECTLLPRWSVCALTWVYFTACVCACGVEGAAWQHLPAALLADGAYVLFVGAYVLVTTKQP